MTFRPSIVIKASGVTRMAINGFVRTGPRPRRRRLAAPEWQLIAGICLLSLVSKIGRAGELSRSLRNPPIALKPLNQISAPAAVAAYP